MSILSIIQSFIGLHSRNHKFSDDHHIQHENFTIEKFREQGTKIALQELSSSFPSLPVDFFKSIYNNEKSILRSHRSYILDIESGGSITPSIELILDNYYIVEEAIKEIKRSFSNRLYKQLPSVRVSGLKVPRIVVLISFYVSHTCCVFSHEKLVAIVEGFQSVEDLTIGELKAIPGLLRFFLIDRLQRLLIRVEHSRQMRQKASDAVNQLLAMDSVSERNSFCNELEAFIKHDTFITFFLLYIKSNLPDLESVFDELEKRFKEVGRDLNLVSIEQQKKLNADSSMISSIIDSLRKIDSIQWALWIEEVSSINLFLRKNSDYGELDSESRNQYCNIIENLARRSGCSEMQVAKKAISMLADVSVSEKITRPANIGDFLIGLHSKKIKKQIRYKTTFFEYFEILLRKFHWLSIAVPTILLTIVVVKLAVKFLIYFEIPFMDILIFIVLFSIPASEVASGLFNALISNFLKPIRLVGYEFKNGIPAEARTLVVVPCLIDNRDTVDSLLRVLEVHYLSNPSGDVSFALLSDWIDSDYEDSPFDLELLAYAKEEVRKLSERYPRDGIKRFFLLHRRRLFNPSEGVWMGWERKRGKLEELNHLLRGSQNTSFIPGSNVFPSDVQYVMTLDVDTRLIRDSVTRIVGKMHHPVNRPLIDIEKKRVIYGYGLMQPRVIPSFTTNKQASIFQRIFSVDRGVDPYIFTVSDLYQDIAGEGTFTGKGLYHVDVLKIALEGRIKENTVLSHDLLEGAFARCALVTDIELVENFPTRYEVEMARQHRWIRGDWQLFPYILNPFRGVPALGRWKMLDNIRRSLVPIFWLITVVFSWICFPVFVALIWQFLMILCLFVAPTLSLISKLIPKSKDIVHRVHFYNLYKDIYSANAQIALRIVFIVDTACVSLDAIVRAIYRMLISRKLMLQWQQTASVISNKKGGLLFYYYKMLKAPVLSIFFLYIVGVFNSSAYFVCLPFILLWILSPAIAWFVSQSTETEDNLIITETVSFELRKIARRTWNYFDHFVTPEQNFLPPDNFQEYPSPVIAARTSPTNIGVYLLSVVSARKFGWISFEETIERLENTFATLEKMDKFRGHLYNWYETDTLKVLNPMYVSTVDSGNIAAHFLVVSSACQEWAKMFFVYMKGDIEGIKDVLGILKEEIDSLLVGHKTVGLLKETFQKNISVFRVYLESPDHNNFLIAEQANIYLSLAQELQKLAAFIHQEVQSGSSLEIVKWVEQLIKVCQAHIKDHSLDISQIEIFRNRLDLLYDLYHKFSLNMKFDFLFNKDRNLLSIGYKASPWTQRLDENCYDMIASEARLASLFAIAKGDVPTQNWYKLKRQLVSIGSQVAFLSWSGSMFEYLMPTLVMQELKGGIFDQTNNLIIKQQIKYGDQNNIPWGISESAYNAFGDDFSYHYSAFGVPILGIKRGLSRHLVISPYSTILASQYIPEVSLSNIKKLRSYGALGIYGFYDSIDFTPDRVKEDQSFSVVYNYYAHHHGMSIAAICNVVFHGWLRKLFHSNPIIESVELLLQERIPQDARKTNLKHETKAIVKIQQENILHPEVRIFNDPLYHERQIAFFSNGEYATMLTSLGTGYSRCKGQAISRWKADLNKENTGFFIFLRDIKTNDWWSATAEPRSIEGEISKVIFRDEKAEFIKKNGNITSHVECIVSSNSNAEGRNITINNAGEEECFIELTSYVEPVICKEENDNVHSAFSRMFVKTEISQEDHFIIAERHKRLPNDIEMVMAHLVVHDGCIVDNIKSETNRRNFIGRGRSISNAAAFDSDAEFSCKDGFSLDPVLSLRFYVRILPKDEVTVTFWNIVASNRAELEKDIAFYKHPNRFNIEMDEVVKKVQSHFIQIGITSQQALAFQKLGYYLVYPDNRFRVSLDVMKSSLKPQSILWPLSISGDFPIFTLRVNDDLDIEIVRESLLAHEYLCSVGVISDLVIINERKAFYAEEIQTIINSVCESFQWREQAKGLRQHIFLLRRDLIDPLIFQALLAISRVVLHACNGKIIHQIMEVTDSDDKNELVKPLYCSNYRQKPEIVVVDKKCELEFWNGYGGFSNDGLEYNIQLIGGQVTPNPWINIVSGENFGFHVSAEGAGFTWSQNSRDYKITPWSNDPVINLSGEAFYIYDKQNSSVFTPLPAISNSNNISFNIRHGLGYSVFSSIQNELEIELTQTIDRLNLVKLSCLKLKNLSNTSRQLCVYSYVEWVLGINSQNTAPFIMIDRDEATGALLANNPYNLECCARTAFLASSKMPSGFTSSRKEFLGGNFGDIFMPQAVVSGSALSGTLDTYGDPVSALAVDVNLSVGEEYEVVFYLGDSASKEEAKELIHHIVSPSFSKKTLESEKDFWKSFVGLLQVETPDKALNYMVNTWLPYQSLGCRIMARSAFYQASGAFGFRDQLQDTLAFLIIQPNLARQQIIRAASNQFQEGDVFHWWLPGTGAGVRTLISDDVVWLAYAIDTYCSVTGDFDFLNEEVSFIEGKPLAYGQHDAFFKPEISKEKASIYEHAARAIDLAIKRTGKNDLPLILGGDWNDGMNLVGIQGKGTSVWLGWFLAGVLKKFIPIAKLRHDFDRLLIWEKHFNKLKDALENFAWDGEYYLRGTFDDGSPLGSSKNDDCAIDSISQSWSVLSGIGDKEHSNKAMDAVLKKLVDEENKIILLFTPPFVKAEKNPGYIKFYPPGVRENGGQYTHAAAWVVMALIELGRYDEAWKCFAMLMPINHSLTYEQVQKYKVEPYAVAADVYSQGDYKGQGGWTWYTGSAAWLYRVAIEGILGVRKKGNTLYVNPAAPSIWPSYNVKIVLQEKIYLIKAINDKGKWYVTINGKRIDDQGYNLDSKE
ncbi:LOW QUALITY PROTEIN: Cyclic beta-1,2-glucan synthase [Liberibacter crescens BT-1]|uniref:Cyclic beta-1,2-glucan synthase n=1 Tax=Liberibacter crescens (strain BT-1) TaxID=1215343 RepID=L0ETR1_LIBCB|nr:LOW QUALITY PROTEIN: Cyclic beta-1,2-glucan synthase [Liberibacter crescens BT-1]